MKTKYILALVLAVFGLLTLAFAQEASPLDGLSKDMLDKPLNEWQLNLTTLALAAMILGRAFKAWKNGGGLLGIWRGFLHGENVPQDVAKDYPTKPGTGNGGTILPLLLLFCLLPMFPGCATVKNATPQQVDIAASITKIAVSQIVTPVLTNNPRYEPALLALASGVDVALAVDSLTPEGINAFLDTLALKYEMNNETRVLIGNGILDLLQLYKDTYQVEEALISDPRLTKMLDAFRTGIKQGIERYHTFSAH
jgi:hypothetical protein